MHPRTIRILKEPHCVLIIDDLRRYDVVVAQSSVATVVKAACGARAVGTICCCVGVDEGGRCGSDGSKEERKEFHRECGCEKVGGVKNSGVVMVVSELG